MEKTIVAVYDLIMPSEITTEGSKVFFTISVTREGDMNQSKRESQAGKIDARLYAVPSKEEAIGKCLGRNNMRYRY